MQCENSCHSTYEDELRRFRLVRLCKQAIVAGESMYLEDEGPWYPLGAAILAPAGAASMIVVSMVPMLLLQW